MMTIMNHYEDLSDEGRGEKRNKVANRRIKEFDRFTKNLSRLTDIDRMCERIEV